MFDCRRDEPHDTTLASSCQHDNALQELRHYSTTNLAGNVTINMLHLSKQAVMLRMKIPGLISVLTK